MTTTERDDKLGGHEGSQSRSHPMTFSISKTRELCDAATEGPWAWFTSCSWKRLKHDRRGLTLNVAEPFVASDGHPDLTISREDMAFIAHARTALPQVLDAYEEAVRLLQAAPVLVVDRAAAEEADDPAALAYADAVLPWAKEARAFLSRHGGG